jgi:HD-GYP domain-containing protein (c-di-GMP phosphodiesterase class II)
MPEMSDPVSGASPQAHGHVPSPPMLPPWVPALASRCRALSIWIVQSRQRPRVMDDEHEPLCTQWLASALGLMADIGEDRVPGLWIADVTPGQSGTCTELRAVAIGPELFRQRLFMDACGRAGLDCTEVERALQPHARWASSSAWLLGEVAARAARDEALLHQHREAIGGFTRQLTDSYETINLLYALAREMDDPSKPGEIVNHVCERLAECGALGFVGVAFGQSRSTPPEIRGRVHSTGRTFIVEWFRHAGHGLAERCGEWHGTNIVSSNDSGAPVDLVVHPLCVAGQPMGVLVAGDRSSRDGPLSSYESQLVEAAGRYLAGFLHNCSLYAQQQALFLGTIKALSASIDAKDRYTRGHSERVAHLGRRLALAIGLSEDQAERVHLSGLLHDVGKIGVPEAVLCKQGRLTDEEFELIKAHPEIGARILEGIPLLEDVLPGVLHHHERYDGKGYPARLAGEQIPLVARILAVADAFDAMSSTRSYRPAMSREIVLQKMREGLGTQFDPVLGEVFQGLDLSEYDRLVAQAESAGSPGPVPMTITSNRAAA